MHDGQNDLVSVIVPVYKVEEYLRECVDSIINQTYKNLEIILVDDGSPDKCGEICDEYARNDSRITVYHKENGGTSDARNYGIDRCRGDFITFLDSDDVLKSSFVETLLGLIHTYDADVAMSAVQRFHELPGGDADSIFMDREINISVLSGREMVEGVLYQKYGSGSNYSLYKRRIYESIRFPCGLYDEDPKGIYAEDLAITHKIHMLCGRVVVTNEHMYGYRYNLKSISLNGYSPKMLACIPISRQLYDDICADVPELKKAAASRAFSTNRATYFNIPYSLKEERMKVWEEMKKYRREVLFDPHARKRERLAALVSYLGPGFFHMFSRLYRRYLMRERG